MESASANRKSDNLIVMLNFDMIQAWTELCKARKEKADKEKEKIEEEIKIQKWRAEMDRERLDMGCFACIVGIFLFPRPTLSSATP